MAAVQAGHHELVTWLLDRGASANARSNGEPRQTALHEAAWNGDIEMVRMLLADGADIAIRDAQYDATPEGWALTSLEMTNNAACAAAAELLAEAARSE